MNIVIRSDKDLRNNNEGLKEYRHHNFTVKLRAINLLSCEKLRNILIPTVCTTLALYCTGLRETKLHPLQDRVHGDFPCNIHHEI